MNLAEFTVKNYKSLRDVKVDFGNYTTLIGENGSGKTSVLEALYLFFRDFDIVGGTPSPILQENSTWHNSRLPLEFSAEIVLDEEECREIFPEDMLDRLVEKYGDGYKELSIAKQIPKPGDPWETALIRIAKVPFVKDNAVVSPEELTKALTKGAAERPTGRVKAFLFDPNANQSNLVGDRLIVLNNIAYHMDDYADGLVREGKIPFEQLPGANYREWAMSQGLELVEGPPAKEDIDVLLTQEALLITNEILQNAQNKIVEKIKGKLKLIPATRNERIEPGERAPFLNGPTIIDPLANLHTSNFEAWYEIESAVEKLIKQRLDSVPTLSTREANLRLPIHLIGGGQQEVVGLLHQIYTASEPIIAIEEPETHLHHNLCKNLFKLLKELLPRKQLIVATHSEDFAEISVVTKNWFLEKKTKETKLKEIKSERGLIEAFGSLGAEPSDRGYPNKILFVSGETEEGVLPIWAQKMGIDLNKVRVEALEGEYDKRKIPVVADYIKDAQTKIFLMVDSHASDDVKQVKNVEGKVILKGTIEDCYPIPILVQVLNENYGLELTENDIAPKLPRVEEIKKLLHKERGIPKTKTIWKPSIGKEVAKRMSEGDIPKEIKDFIMKVAN